MHRIEVSLFDRVFDLTPKPEVWSLDELASRLTRFEVKTAVARKVERDLERADAAWAAVQRGDHETGPQGTALARAMREARQWGRDPREAAEQAYLSMRSRIKKRVKSELHLWSPAVYPPGTEKRGTEYVLRLSCLVLDYDGGLPVRDARSLWEGWWSVLHTTWSHSAETPKFRVVLPLSRPIEASRWPTLWDWAMARGGEGLDLRTGESSRMWALPAVGSHEQLRECHISRGPLLDPDAVLEAVEEEWDFNLYAEESPASAALPPQPSTEMLDLAIDLLAHFDSAWATEAQREELREIIRLHRQGLGSQTREALERLAQATTGSLPKTYS